MQIVHPMTGEEALKLSVAQYFTAAGRQIDRIGITPDIAVSQEGLVFDPESDTVILRAVQELMKSDHMVLQTGNHECRRRRMIPFRFG